MVPENWQVFEFHNFSLSDLLLYRCALNGQAPYCSLLIDPSSPPPPPHQVRLRCKPSEQPLATNLP